MPWQPSTEQILIGLAAALGSGLLIGIERERRKGSGPRRAFAGVRTFALASLAGAGAQLSAQPLLLAAGAILIAALAAIGYWRERSRDPGITTEVALFVTYVIGVVSLQRPALAAGAAVVVAALLASRASLHRLSVDALTESELRDGLLFCGAALIVLPLLPDRGAAWLPALNLRRLWGLVVLFMGLQAAGYIAVRVAGPRVGLAVSGLASGFVSSTATIAALGARARRARHLLGACVSGALFSTVATVVLLAVVVATVKPDAMGLLAPSLAAGLASAVLAAGMSLRTRAGAPPAPAEIRGRAFNLLYALGFAVLLSAVAAVLAWITGRFGHTALAAGSALAGFADVHAAAASVLSIAAATAVPRTGVLQAVLLAFTMNTVSKLAAAFGAGGSAYGLRVAAGLLLVVAAMWAPLLWI